MHEAERSLLSATSFDPLPLKLDQPQPGRRVWRFNANAAGSHWTVEPALPDTDSHSPSTIHQNQRRVTFQFLQRECAVGDSVNAWTAVKMYLGSIKQHP